MPLKKCSISIYYCTGCKWLLRSAWYAQELLSSFEDEIQSLSLIPSDAGRFSIKVDEQEIWDRKKNDGFPEIKHLKRMVRDLIAPDKNLGHCEVKQSNND